MATHLENLKLSLGKRVLIAVKGGYSHSPSSLFEFKIIEISPSEQFIKVMDENGRKIWKHVNDFTPIEMLVDREAHPNNSTIRS